MLHNYSSEITGLSPMLGGVEVANRRQSLPQIIPGQNQNEISIYKQNLETIK